MIFGAEGAIALINIVILIGVLVTFGMVASYFLMRPRNWWLISILLVLALPSWGAGVFFLVDYVKNKPYNDAFALNNANNQRVIQAIHGDDLTQFKLALAKCGNYCIGTPNVGAKKYDSLIIYAGYRNAKKIIAYLANLNVKEMPAY